MTSNKRHHQLRDYRLHSHAVNVALSSGDGCGHCRICTGRGRGRGPQLCIFMREIRLTGIPCTRQMISRHFFR